MPEPERHVSPLAGAYNFRDLGGLPAGGRRVRTGVLFRSDTLQALTGADVRRLVDELGVRLVIDLRGGAEAVGEGRGPLATTEVCYLNAPLRDAPASDLDPREQTLRFYLDHLAAPAPTLATVIRVLAAMAGGPAVVHCAAGKDRTGLVVALVLRMIGVSRADVAADYLATARNMPRVIERFRTWPRYRAHMATVHGELYQAREHTILGLLDELDTRYRGARGWAHSRGIDEATLDRLSAALLD